MLNSCLEFWIRANAGAYELTDDDRAHIDAFEKMADTDAFLKPPSDQRSSLDTHWHRLCSKAKQELAVHQAVAQFERSVQRQEE
jgi:hypothetical protein